MYTRFVLIAFTPTAKPDSNGHISPVCDPHWMILNSLESWKSLVSNGSGFITFGLAVWRRWAEEYRLPKLDWILAVLL